MDPLSALARRLLRHRLRGLAHGQLTLTDGSGTEQFGVPGVLDTTITVLDPRFYRAVIFGGAVAAGESYAAGWWTTHNLTSVVRLMVRNRALLEAFETGPARAVQPLRQVWHALRRNTLAGSRRNISAHYDLGNDFFECVLDDTLTYSCGIFTRPGATLRDAAIAKYDRIAQLLELSPDDHLLEIGTGWGGFAIHAATHYGCRVTTTTISEQQFAHAAERISTAGLSERITLLKKDYRALTGQYTRLASIEMIEAVGHEHFETFFDQCAALLAPDGRAVVQAITIDDARYEGARKEVDFVKRHIFPGSCIPSEAVLRRTSTRAGFRIAQADEIGLHYAETLRRWHANMAAHQEPLRAMGYDDRFQRLWAFYFCYCEGGFLERAIGNLQITLVPAGSQAGPARAVPSVPDVPAAA